MIYEQQNEEAKPQQNCLRKLFLEKYDFDEQIQNFRNKNQARKTLYFEAHNYQNIVCGVDITKNKLLNNLYVKLNKIQEDLFVEPKSVNCQQKSYKIVQNQDQLKNYQNLIQRDQFNNSFGQVNKIKSKLQKLLIRAKKNIQNSKKYEYQAHTYANLIQDEQKNIRKLQEQIFEFQEEINFVKRRQQYENIVMNIY